LALASLIAWAVPLVSGCAPVDFVPSPYTPQKVELIYSAQEDITIVRWRISSADQTSGDLSFQLLSDTGYQGVDFSQSAYPGGAAPCADGIGSCFQYVFRGPAPTWWGGARPVQAVHDTFGVLPGSLPKRTSVTNTVLLTSFFNIGNDVVYVDITDTVASQGAYVFPRSYDRTMWPTKGLCLSDSPPDGVTFSPLEATGGFPPPSPLTDDGYYCVGVRPLPTDAGDAVLAQTRVETLPQVTARRLDYAPPIQKSPILYQIVLDLSIQVASRCDSSIAQIESAVRDALKKAGEAAGVPVVEIPEINLALDPSKTDDTSKCSQMTTRTLPADDIAAEVKQKVVSFPEKYQQFHFFYFNNLDAPLPDTLVTSLQRLSDDLGYPPPGYQLDTISFGFAGGLANANGPTWTNPEPWFKSADDSRLVMTLSSYAEGSLPYESQIYDSGSTPVPFFTTDDANKFNGGRLKLCDFTTAVAPVDMAQSTSLGPGPTWPIDAADPPGFKLFVSPPVDTPAASFVPVAVSIDMQVCTRYCTDHPYVSLAGTGQDSWTRSPLCATTMP
jgi:hypothetical protein